MAISVAASALLLLLLLLEKKAIASSCSRLPPGPPGWPLVGNIFDLGSLPHARLVVFKHKYGPLIWICLGSVNTLVVSSAEAAMDMFKNHDHSFSDGHLIESLKSDDTISATIALSDYGPYWRMMRRLYTIEIFSRKRIHDTAPVRRRCVDKMIKWISDEANKGASTIEVASFVLPASFNLISNLVFSRDDLIVDPKSTKGNEFFELNSQLTYTTIDQFFCDELICNELIIMPNLADFFPYLRWIDPQGVKKCTQELLTTGTENIVVTIEWAMAELLRKPEAMKCDTLEIMKQH
ncbi:Cytochrome P450 [Macleaya cordata]|uniref:Cytochrome P450 n=1 Tax=Macleaya cordata TaxID=56857 RepID=A0A200QRZ0_MACCD|nr:Cytochrome P450 [Macleaya cordata]